MTPSNYLNRRRFLQAAAGTTAVGVVGLAAPAVFANTRPFEGVTINGAGMSSMFAEFIKKLLPEFEESSGIKVNFSDQAFGVYNQQMDLELSTGGSAYDFAAVTFIYSARWIGAGWLHPLDDFASDPNMNPTPFDPQDFAAGAQTAMRGTDGSTYGYTFEAGAMIMGASRGDLLDEAGVEMPRSFEELISVCQAVHQKDDVSAFVASNLHHWNWIPFLMGFGGEVFAAPPEDLMPVFDSVEGAEAIEYYARLLTEFSPDGVLSYEFQQATEAQLSGRANLQCQALSFLTPMAKDPESTVSDTVRYSLMPGGPAGSFPGSNSHGYGIPAGARNKEAAWHFLSWMLGKDVQTRLALEEGYTAIARESIITSAPYRERMTLNGTDVASLYLDVLNLGGDSGYMKYRTVPIFPQVGGFLNKAVEAVATGQMNGRDALAQAKKGIVIDLRKAGIRL
jgi:multiple sugar transport system substrate-binding protein